MFQHENNLKSLTQDTSTITNVVSTNALLTLETPFLLSANLNRKKITVYVAGEGNIDIFVNNVFIVNIGQYHYQEFHSDIAKLPFNFISENSQITVAQYS